MVGRTPEYLGKKIGGREMKLAMIALLIHPIMILGPTGVFAATSWGMKAENNPAAHGFSEILYQFSSASANNGSAFDPDPLPQSEKSLHLRRCWLEGRQTAIRKACWIECLQYVDEHGRGICSAVDGGEQSGSAALEYAG